MAVLHRASWVVPVTSAPIQNGAVLVEHGRVVKVAKSAEFKGLDAKIIDYGQGVLMPGLVNGHTHLELSHCVATVNDNPGDMVAWIADLLRFRETYTDDDVVSRAGECVAGMILEGVDLIVDIGNDPSFVRSSSDSKVLFFHELLGLSQKAALFMGEVLESRATNYTCHAPYSTSLSLLQQIKRQASDLKHIMPIHVAESLAEMDFIKTGQGDFKLFLEERGFWDGSFVAPESSPVKYLNDLGLLDPDTLCVHCVHVDEHDLQTLYETEAKVCLCLGSNEYLGVGLPPVPQMLEIGLLPCLGTDSLASNPQVSIWREMNLVHQHFPTVTAAQIIHMATRNGATALQCSEYGSLSAGAVSMIFVEYAGNTPLDYLSFNSSPKQVTRCM